MQICVLRDVGIRDLNELFQEEALIWEEQLFWDYRPTQQVIKRFIASRNLPGYIVRSDDNQIAAYAYFIVDRPVGFIGDLFVKNCYACTETYSMLLGRVVEFLAKLDFVTRIESQVFPLNFDLVSVFSSYGFRALRRLFLCASLEEAEADVSPAAEPFQIGSWSGDLLCPSSDVIYDSYLGSADADLCRDYQSRKGCLRFLRNLIDNPACGTFSVKETVTARDSEGRLCGLLLASRINHNTGMIPQLSIRRDCQGKGLGKMLLSTYMKRAKSGGIRRVTLSVTESNRRAYRLYQRMGFQVRKEFHAFVWQRQQR